MSWYVDRMSYSEAITDSEEYVDVGFVLGKASASTLAYTMQDSGEPPARRAHVREREMVTNVLSMASVHRIITSPNPAGRATSTIPAWRAEKAIVFAARSLELLRITEMQEFQRALRRHRDAEVVDAYTIDSGSLAQHFAMFFSAVLERNAEYDRQYGE